MQVKMEEMWLLQFFHVGLVFRTVGGPDPRCLDGSGLSAKDELPGVLALSSMSLWDAVQGLTTMGAKGVSSSMMISRWW